MSLDIAELSSTLEAGKAQTASQTELPKSMGQSNALRQNLDKSLSCIFPFPCRIWDLDFYRLRLCRTDEESELSLTLGGEARGEILWSASSVL